MKILRSAEIWIFGAFGALVAAACLDAPDERAMPGVRTSAAAVPGIERVQPTIDPAQPMYIVYVFGKRPSAAEKRALRAGAG